MTEATVRLKIRGGKVLPATVPERVAAGLKKHPTDFEAMMHVEGHKGFNENLVQFFIESEACNG
jgi:hypothetical protein